MWGGRLQLWCPLRSPRRAWHRPLHPSSSRSCWPVAWGCNSFMHSKAGDVMGQLLTRTTGASSLSLLVKGELRGQQKRG